MNGLYAFLTIIQGLRDLLLLDVKAFARFDATPAGAGWSFLASALVAPFHFLSITLATGDSDGLNGGQAVVLVIDYVVRWTAWPVLLWSLCPRIACRRERYFHYLTVSNWFAATETLLFLSTTLVPVIENSDAVLFTLVFSMLLLYEWFITRCTLLVSRGTASLLVASNLFLGMVIARTTQIMVGG
ncbi:MAG: hypothetical protein FD149_2765 [Rhodospirillaceae bacterium]|nr:MAG: hypothetical protein FD149_2765 [Rhodospirillaceae bacterium]